MKKKLQSLFSQKEVRGRPAGQETEGWGEGKKGGRFGSRDKHGIFLFRPYPRGVETSGQGPSSFDLGGG